MASRSQSLFDRCVLDALPERSRGPERGTCLPTARTYPFHAENERSRQRAKFGVRSALDRLCLWSAAHSDGGKSVATSTTPASGDDQSAELALSHFRPMNERFYYSTPHTYFEQRLCNLLLLASREGLDLGVDLTEGVSIGPCEFRVDPNEHIETSLSADALEQFVTTESVVLLHHAAETLVRFYLAHEQFQACPGLEVAALSHGKAFWEQVQSRIIDAPAQERLRRVSWVFFGGENANESWSLNDDEWQRTRTNAVRLLEAFASRLVL